MSLWHNGKAIHIVTESLLAYYTVFQMKPRPWRCMAVVVYEVLNLIMGLNPASIIFGQVHFIPVLTYSIPHGRFGVF